MIRWELDEFNCLNLRFKTLAGPVHAWIQERPSYCDRGHFQLNIDGPFDFDGSDCFPRYYMDLTTALQEAERFLAWRIAKRSNMERGRKYMVRRHKQPAIIYEASRTK